MRKLGTHWIPAVILPFSLAVICLGWWMTNWFAVAGGVTGICYVVPWVVPFGRVRRKKEERVAAKPAVGRSVKRAPADPNDTDALVEQMLAQGRFALLLRAQIAETLSKVHFRRTLEALDDAMTLVPDGEVVLGRIDEALNDGKLMPEEIIAGGGRVIRVERFFLDRFPVTNREFHEFTSSGGYEQMALWDRSVLPAVLDFVDHTGVPGPRFWRDGCFPPGEENHPVVGISWYEASAYARWLGKRLPSDAEWVKAGSWPMSLAASTPSVAKRMQRKYPWGDTMDRGRANLWGSGPDRTIPVEASPDGVSVGGVHQLIGNTWEWIGGDFRGGDHPEGELELPTPMKSIRGGAFDTYFDNQATCQFQSGENPLSRKHNIGFRCAVCVCDLTLARDNTATAEPRARQENLEQPKPEAEEVPV